MILSFNRRYFTIFIIVFLVEVSIALFVRDNFVRPYLGDFLVVMLLYCFLKSFFKISLVRAALLVLGSSYLVEMLQYFQVIRLLGLGDKVIATTVLGTQFEWWDMIAYTAGVGAIFLIEKLKNSESS